MPKELDFPSCTTCKWEDEPDDLVDLVSMHRVYPRQGEFAT